MSVQQKGKRRVRHVGGAEIYDYRSPGIDFEHDYLLDKPKELAKLSSKVISYKLSERVREV